MIAMLFTRRRIRAPLINPTIMLAGLIKPLAHQKYHFARCAYVYLLVTGLLAGCSTSSTVNKPTAEKDYGPRSPVDVSHIPDAVPRHEPRTIAGNKSPYTILGKTYYVLPQSSGYKEQGIASWYGNKFHGKNTANGEVYNIYAMTAAHKTLPIPSYVRVRNLENGKSIVVRVNDRGPFHSGRIIDLSYAGAKKLGFIDKGTARVEVEAIDPPAPLLAAGQEAAVATAVAQPAVEGSVSGEAFLPDNTFLQVGAFSNYNSALSLQETIRKLTEFPVFISTLEQNKVLYRVRIGPVKRQLDAADLHNRLVKNNLPTPQIVYH